MSVHGSAQRSVRRPGRAASTCDTDATGLAGDWRFWILVIVFTFPISLFALLGFAIHGLSTRIDRGHLLPDLVHWALAAGAVLLVLWLGALMLSPR